MKASKIELVQECCFAIHENVVVNGQPAVAWTKWLSRQRRHFLCFSVSVISGPLLAGSQGETSWPKSTLEDSCSLCGGQESELVGKKKKKKQNNNREA